MISYQSCLAHTVHGFEHRTGNFPWSWTQTKHWPESLPTACTADINTRGREKEVFTMLPLLLTQSALHEAERWAAEQMNTLNFSHNRLATPPPPHAHVIHVCLIHPPPSHTSSTVKRQPDVYILPNFCLPCFFLILEKKKSKNCSQGFSYAPFIEYEAGVFTVEAVSLTHTHPHTHTGC